MRHGGLASCIAAESPSVLSAVGGKIVYHTGQNSDTLIDSGGGENMGVKNWPGTTALVASIIAMATTTTRHRAFQTHARTPAT
jgi:hypothetical protein